MERNSNARLVEWWDELHWAHKLKWIVATPIVIGMTLGFMSDADGRRTTGSYDAPSYDGSENDMVYSSDQ